MTDEQKQIIRSRIGQRITALRNLHGMTITELADKSGLQRSHISRIEVGKYSVNIETLQSIAEAFGMTVDIIDERLTNLAPLVKLV